MPKANTYLSQIHITQFIVVADMRGQIFHGDHVPQMLQFDLRRAARVNFLRSDGPASSQTLVIIFVKARATAEEVHVFGFVNIVRSVTREAAPVTRFLSVLPRQELLLAGERQGPRRHVQMVVILVVSSHVRDLMQR